MEEHGEDLQDQGGAAQGSTRRLPFRFTGGAGEYFRIWIVNVLLSIVTLGVYSAWAKVRNKQYFYRHTWVGESCFEYHGDPILILKGRLIIGGFFAAMFLSQWYSPVLYLLLGLVLFVLSPWIAVKAMSFNARNSSYRNVRFSFRGDVGTAYQIFLLMPILNVFALGFLAPLIHQQTVRFTVSNHRYGKSCLSFRGLAGPFYLVYFMALLMMIGIMVLIFPMLLTGSVDEAPDVLPIVVLYLAFLLPTAFIKASVANLTFNNTHLEKHRFASQQAVMPLLFIYVINLVGIFVSLGLLVPWAKVRLARYRATCLTLLPDGGLEVLVDKEREEQSAIGEAAADFGDFDFGI